MKAFVDGNQIGLVNDDFVDIQASEVVWVDRIDMNGLKCPHCGGTTGKVYSFVCDGRVSDFRWFCCRTCRWETKVGP